MSYALAQQRAILEPTLDPLVIDWDLQFLRPPARRAWTYWDSLRGDRAMPRRQELSPSGMREFLPHANLVDIVGGCAGETPDFRISLQGQHGTEIYGMVANRPLEEVLPARVVPRWRHSFLTCYRAALPVRISSRMLIGGRAWLEGEAFLAPLGDNETGIQSLFAVMVSWQAEGFGGTGTSCPA